MATAEELAMIDELQGLTNPSQGYNPSGNYAGSTTSGGYDYSGVSSQSVDQLIQDVGGRGSFLGGLFNTVLGNLGTFASGAGGLASLMGAYDRLGAVGERGLAGAGQIAEEAFARSQFKPFTVTTGTGTSLGVGIPAPGSFPEMGREARIQQLMQNQGLTREQAIANQRFSQTRGFDINNDGVVTDQEFAAARNAGLTGGGAGGGTAGGGAFTGAGPMIGPNIQTVYSPTEQAISSGAFTGAQTLLDAVTTGQATREQDIYDRIRATQMGEEERLRLALEERLASQGRLGVQTAMFGGTPEQLTLAKAQEEAQARASLAAIQQAQAEQAQQAQLGTQLLSAAYLPEAQAQNALQRALLASQLAQRGQLYGTGLFGEASIAGLDALLQSATQQANLMGQLGTGLLGGAVEGSGGGQGGLLGIIGDIGKQVAPDILDILGLGTP